MYRILEDYGCTGTPNEGTKMTPDQQFERIARIENEHPWLRGRIIDGVADPAIWDGSRGESIYDTACRHQIYFRKGINDRIPGWMQVHYRFQFDENGYPRMYVFRNCKDFIRTIPLMQYDNNKVEDLDSDLEDHIADETTGQRNTTAVSEELNVENLQRRSGAAGACARQSRARRAGAKAAERRFGDVEIVADCSKKRKKCRTG